MKILIIGFLALFSWSALSTHIYVCKIKGLCDEPITMQVDVVNHKDVIAGDTLNKIIIESKGEKEPADDNNTKAGRANNRRTVITIKK